jgi:hypothetical protein
VITEVARWANDPKNKAEVQAFRVKYAPGHVDPGPVAYATTFDPAGVQPIFDAALKYKLLAQPLALDTFTYKLPNGK